MPFSFIHTRLPGVMEVIPQVFGDNRGFFLETYRTSDFAEAGIDCDFVQDNHSRSQRGVVRGLHYQLCHAQAKLVRVIIGEICDVAVDIRRGSPTFGQATTCILSAENKRMLFVPRGFAHGFAVLSEYAEVIYKTDNVYAPHDEYGIAYNDPALDVAWGVDEPLLSGKDKQLPTLADVPEGNLPAYEG